mmetsp:Transcript_69996/g.226423  ORF Transcript_69996/g.226423 Transcript_69996/m.226423 type:complete len:536 (+) Transcript_69996:132-1739(+)
MRPRNFAAPLISKEVYGDDVDTVHPMIVRQSSSESAQLARYGLLEAPASLPSTPMLEHAAPRAESLDGPVPPLCHVQASDPELVPPSRGFGAWCQRLLAFTGPGWLMSIAYVDPGNLEADLQCGAQFGYSLLWALLVATSIGLGMQLIAARLGCATRRHLAEHCQEHYPPYMRAVLWFLTELAIVGSDIQEVIGCSIGLQLLLGLRLSTGVLVTAAAAFGFLFLERLGTRPLELFFGVLIMILAVSMGGLFAVIRPDTGAVLEGLTVPRMPPSSVKQVVGMLGCVIMPHNLFLHSALVQSRVIHQGEEREAVFLFGIESTVAIFTSLLINTSVVAVFAKGFYGTSAADVIGLRTAGFYLGEAFGNPMRLIWALGLCAAGQSSTMTGAYAGQWVMQGYLQLKVKPWKRAIITRSMALVPTLTVSIYFGGGHAGLDALNTYLNCLQSLVLPFAVVPLLTFVGTRQIMGDLVLSPVCLGAGWLATGLIMVVNIYLFIEQFEGDLMSGGLTGTIGLATGILVYLLGIAYVAWVPLHPAS